MGSMNGRVALGVGPAVGFNDHLPVLSGGV